MNQPKTPCNEVARLRELLNRAIENCECEPKCSSHFASYCDCGRYRRNKEIREELARPAPAPEKPVTHPLMDCQVCGEFRGYGHECKEPATEWRELGEDEVICEGDEVQPKHHDKINGEWQKAWSFELGVKAGHFKAMRYRTRRPLPVKEEKCPHHSIVPLEQGDTIVHQCTRCGKKLKKYPKPQEDMPLEDDGGWKLRSQMTQLEKDLYDISHLVHGDKIGNCIRYLRDEIQKLKSNQQ